MYATMTSGLEIAEPLAHRIPGDHLIEGGDIIRANVFVLQIVGVLPNVDSQQRGSSCHPRAGFIGRRFIQIPPLSSELSQAHPLPKTLSAAFVSWSRHPGKLPNLVSMACANSPCGRSEPSVVHDLPKKGMICVTTAVVTDNGANRFGDFIQVPNQFLNGHRGNIRVVRYRVVQIIHIRRMVLVMMEMHRFGVNVFLTIHRSLSSP